jgi:hypothetical protein
MLARRKKLGIVTRALIASARDNHGLPPQQCRVVPKAALTPEAPYYIYKDKVTIIKARAPIRIILIRNPLLADSFRAQFLYHWNAGKSI